MVDESLNYQMKVIDLRSAADPAKAAEDWMRAEYSAPIDLLTDRLIGSAVLRLGDDRYYWYARIHHIALDGFGAMTYMNRVAELYTAAVEGRAPAELTASPIREVCRRRGPLPGVDPVREGPQVLGRTEPGSSTDDQPRRRSGRSAPFAGGRGPMAAATTAAWRDRIPGSPRPRSPRSRPSFPG